MKLNLNSFGVYSITNVVNGQRYIGSTAISFAKRWGTHLKLLKQSKNSTHLQHAWDKYGKQSFQFRILEIVKNSSLVVGREQYWIDNLKPQYNICQEAGFPPAKLGFKHSDKTRKSMSIIKKGKCPSNLCVLHLSNIGKPKSDEARRHISESLKGRQAHNKGKSPSLEQRKKISVSLMGNTPWNKGLTIGPMSLENRQKISLATKGIPKSEEIKRKLSLRKRGMPIGPMSAEQRKAISISLMGVPRPRKAANQ